MSFIIQPGSTAKSDVYTSSGTWSKPSGVTFVQVQIWGGGGGGGAGGVGTSVAGGGGGGGGGCNTYIFPASVLPSSVTVTIGAGGAGAAAQSTGGGAVGSNGGNTTFGTYLTAVGGSGGTIATYQAGGAGGGNGFNTGNGYGTAGGAQAGSSGNGNSAEYGGGSGGAGNTSGAFFGSSGGSSMFGGCGGAGGVPINSSNSGYSLFGGISTDTVGTTNITGAASGTPTSTNGAAGVTQRAIVPVGGGGGGGAAGVPIYPKVSKNFVANNRIFEQISTGLLYTADGGTTWSYINFSFTGSNCIGIGYINSTYYAAMSSGSVYSSTNLSTWTLVSTVPASGGNLNGFCSNGSTLVACGQITGGGSTNFGQMYYSTNGTTWTQGFAGLGYSAYRTVTVRNNNGYFWGYIANDERLGSTQEYQYSADGINWNNVNTGAYYVAALAFGSSNAVGINNKAANSYGLIYGAISGLGTQVLAGTSFADIAYGGGVFVAVAGGGVIYTSSDDGVNWTSQTSGTTDNFNNVVWTGTKFIAYTSQNGLRTYTSTNGVTWTAQTTIAAASFNGGNGGAGGIAGGGGGSGAALSGNNSGIGGTGGNGYARILAW